MIFFLVSLQFLHCQVFPCMRWTAYSQHEDWGGENEILFPSLFLEKKKILCGGMSELSGRFMQSK